VLVAYVCVNVNVVQPHNNIIPPHKTKTKGGSNIYCMEKSKQQTVPLIEDSSS